MSYLTTIPLMRTLQRNLRRIIGSKQDKNPHIPKKSTTISRLDKQIPEKTQMSIHF
jgi:hypothetical protein